MDTKQRILDAAEQMFAEHGFDGASLRSITGAAGVNLAAVNYHFKSKEALVQAVLARKLGPINRRRMELLDAYEAEAGSKPVALEKLLYAMIGPMLLMDTAPASAGMRFGTVMGRVYLERDVKLQRLLIEELRDVIRRVVGAIRRTLPGLPPQELYWRLFFTIGAVSHTLAASDMLTLISGGACEPSDPESTLERLVAYVVPAFRAPLPERLQKEVRRKKGVVAAGNVRRQRQKAEGGPADRRL